MKIFAATSGRSGTGYLWAAFNEFTDLEAYHEEQPILKGDLLVEANTVMFPNCNRLQAKARRIASRGPYVDTAHQFMKGFYPYALDAMPDLKVIHLVRSPLKVMRSRLVRGSWPGNSHWVQSHGLLGQALCLPEVTWNNLTNLQRIAWDWLEHEERFHRVKNRFKQVVELSFDDLTGPRSAEVLTQLFETLGVKHRVDPDKLKGLHRNANSVPSTIRGGDLKQFDRLCNLIRIQPPTRHLSDLSWLEGPEYTGLKDFR